MKTFPADVRFRADWRDYQSRVLAELEHHLRDKKLHVVAAPGSGKTVLGLEVIRRLNQPVLILAPTLTIRDQWVERFTQLFMDTHQHPEWISRDLRAPRLLTVATYQALHAICVPHAETPGATDDDEAVADPVNHTEGEDDPPARSSAAALAELLVGANIGVVALDEAHHLRAEWWRSLTQVIEALPAPTIVALTATPPYDVSAFEWERYENLCGPVDSEIAVPELVARGDLCPHQDYIYFSAPTESERRELLDFRQQVAQFASDLTRNEAFIAGVAAHPWLTQPAAHIEEILDDPEYVSSLLIFLANAGRPLPLELLKLMAVDAHKLPALDLHWLEILLTACLYRDSVNFVAHQEVTREIGRHLRAVGALERRRVVLENPTTAARLLTASVNKLDSIVDIVQSESAALKNDLRAVILADYIRKNEMPALGDEPANFQMLGVVPIFESLRRAKIPDARLAILSGTLVVIPRQACAALHHAAVAAGMDDDDVAVRDLPYDTEFRTVEFRRAGNRSIVALITDLFSHGDVNVVVGTKSLLGEGWDAPSINCLVLASVVGSYMLSNQMRGRAIRTDPAQPEKTANIWHLVTVEPDWTPGEDWNTLVRRFRCFTGVAYDRTAIENGIARLALGEPPFTRERIAEINVAMKARAAERPGLRAAWHKSLAGGVQLVETIETSRQRLPSNFVFSATLAALCWQASWAGLYTLGKFLEGIRAFRGENVWLYLGWAIGISAAVTVPMFLRAAWLFIRHGTLERSMRRVGEALLATLWEFRLIDSPKSQLRVVAEKGDAGSVQCWLNGATCYEKSLFLNCLRELLEPVENARYLLLRKPLAWLGLREDFHPVPEAIARKKERVEHFAKIWRKNVGPAKLVFTRTPEGRRILLRARARSLAAAFQHRSERRSCWR